MSDITMCVPALLMIALMISPLSGAIADATVNSNSCPESSSHCITVRNHCGTPLFLQRTIIDGDENRPSTVTTLPAGSSTTMDISAWQGVSSQRLYAWWIDPTHIGAPDPISMRDKAELFLCGSEEAPRMCYNPTAVDYFGLPVRMSPMNPSDCPATHPTGSDMHLSDMRERCPTHFVSTPPLGVCMSPARVCAGDANNNPLCTALDNVIAQCVQDGNCGDDAISTSNVYDCSGWMGQQPQICAAINRGVYDSDGGKQDDPSLFYRTPPYNEYAAWVHSRSPKQYAFPYDDFQGAGTSGYQECTTRHMLVEWCPADQYNGGASSSARLTTALMTSALVMLMLLSVVVV